MKRNEITDITSISELHTFYNLPGPKHPLITVIDLAKANRNIPETEMFYRLGVYSVFNKRTEGSIKYGKSRYDFDESSVMFTAPGQVISISPRISYAEGWGLFFHPDLLNRSVLGAKIDDYTFFHYDANEALHISEEEEHVLNDCLRKIKREYEQNTDKHTHGLIIDNLQLLLNYCNRFYDRQFFIRDNVNNDVVQRFEKALKMYFNDEMLNEKGLPDVKYFAAQLTLSPNYLSDLLSRYTGKTTQEHIHLALVEKAKTLLWSTEKTISEIAYTLGFEHPSHFTKIFRTKTGKSPSAFRGEA